MSDKNKEKARAKDKKGPRGIDDDSVRVVAVNRKASHDYELVERFEAGLSLLGTEVKSAREGKVNLKDSYAAPRDGELFLIQSHINPYSHGTHENHEPLRPRKLLLHKHELRRLIGKVTERGLTLVPTRMYFKNGRLKVEIALAKGKRQHDRRAAARERDIKRDIEAALKERNK
ncbi:MAG: SsrA-binding protein SmpB [Vicinamibacteria bacterium]